MTGPKTDVPRLARTPVFGAALALGVALSAFSAGYGYERDELYFRMLPPAWGYIDQGPLTPLIARGLRNVLGDQTWTVRIAATLATMATVVVIALLTREFGGGRAAQSLAAWAFAFAAYPMILGHTLLTATVDMPVWPAVMLFVVRAVKHAEPRWWLAAGAVAGVSLYNKLLVAVLLIALVAGLLAVGPRRLLWSRWVALAALLGFVVGLPNLIYQVANSFPELSMGRALADHNSTSVHIVMWPFLIIMLGPPLVPIWIAGLVALWRDRSLRFIAVAFPVLLVLVFLMGSQFYYPFGLLAVLFAAGCAPAWQWVSTRTVWRRLLVIGVVVNAVVSSLLALPIVPLRSLSDTPIAAISQVAQDSVGWPRYVAQVAAVYRQLPPDERAHAVVYASNYGEAGAINRYGPGDGLPAVYSGHNQLVDEGRPPDATTTVVFVGGQYDDAGRWFGSCTVKAHLENQLGVDNEEQGKPVAVCRGPKAPWPQLWPRLHHLD
jgi:4-amino-4-deoxy-L-arabinose transferase-like glycosyltransferase